MTKKRKICVATGSRAEYGLLYCLLKDIQAAPDFELQIIATGMHLSPEFGLTYKIIEENGFAINEKVEMLLSSDTPMGIAKSIGLGTIGFADSLVRLKPDLLVILGDRFEMLAAAQAALVERIPLAHIGGGDTTEGAFDEAIRHSITKMAHLHFVTNEPAARRVRQMGENPAYIFNVGSLGLDYIRRARLYDRHVLENELRFKFRTKNILVTYHPVTLEGMPEEIQVKELLAALDELGPEVGIIITKPNADTGGRKIIKILEEFTNCRSHTRLYTSLGQDKYLSTIAQVDAVVGNSSSGLYEVPSFKKPTVNIGDRQKGRLQAESVINCPAKRREIANAILKAFQMDCSQTVNPYGDGESSQRILDIIKRIPDYQELIQKSFHEVSS